MSSIANRTSGSLWLLALLAAALGFAQAPNNGPITKSGLIEALKIGGLTSQELGQFVELRGVDFQLNEEIAKELRVAGAQPDLIETVAKHYRGGTKPAVPAGPPLSKTEIRAPG